eukprot:TRINITY_DN26319_c0_g1_i1.p1 TRINITY_DN26319_c0_g1~~TRINITY_DN26319_c0_g1_i1.p1  ORF type:complete len:694 (+),score=103.62 TRINITY_DN26319_c0_g1_i1:51-2132(+)
MGGCISCCDGCCAGDLPLPDGHDKQSVIIGERAPGEGAIRRSPSMQGHDLAELLSGDSKTIGDLWKRALAQYGDQRCMGTRQFLREAQEDRTDAAGETKKWTVLEYGPTTWMTYKEVNARVNTIAAGLASLGAQPGDLIGVYEETKADWMMFALACWSSGLTVVTIYTTLGLDGVKHAVNETGMAFLYTNGPMVCNLLDCASEIPALKNVIHNGKLDEKGNNKIKELGGAPFKLVQFEEVVKMGGSAQPPPPADVDPNSLAIVMYTSGTTGAPKGVMISHSNVIAAVATAERRLLDMVKSVRDPIYLGYLPLAHILEMVSELVSLTNGSAIGYGNPRSLTDTNARPHGDISEFKPTTFAGVPRVYDTIKKGVELQVHNSGGLKQYMFNKAFAAKQKALAKGKDTPLWNKLVFKKLKAKLGGNVVHMVSGGAPMNASTQEFMRICFCCSVGQGYGLTETCAMLALQKIHDRTPLTAGSLVSGVECKLVDVDQFTSNDTPHPRGEICVRGPCITQGYFKQQEKTEEAYDKDGWFHTGDIGRWGSKGELQVIGRVKALAKLSNGEYVALEALESTYVNHQLILPSGICVVANSQHNFIVALVLTNKMNTEEFCTQNSVPGQWPDVLRTDAFRKAAIKSLAEEGKRAGLKPVEILKDARFYSDEWTVENGLLTAAMKLKRALIEEKYTSDINGMYGV